MEIEYKNFIPDANEFKDLSSYQCEINKRGQYLKRYLRRTSTELTICDRNVKPLKIYKVYPMDKSKTIDDRFRLYKEAIDYIVSDIIKEKVFD
jgi:hypothetical protein